MLNERVLRIAVGVLALAVGLAGGCEHWIHPPKASFHEMKLPDRDDDYAATAERDTPPERRMEIIQDWFLDETGNYTDDHTGLDRARFPSSRSVWAPWHYMNLGVGFERQSRPKAAANAYWSALGVVSTTFGSRPDRERLRREAFRRLARLAKQDGQHRWAHLLDLSAELAQAYLDSPVATEDQEAFYGQIEKMKESHRKMLEERRRAKAAMARQRRANQAASLSLQSAMRSGAIGLQSAIKGMTEIVASDIEVYQQSEELKKSIKRTKKAIASDAIEIRQVTAGDIPEIQAGRTFVGQQVLFYVASAPPKQQSTYLRRIAERFDTIPSIQRLARAVARQPKPAESKVLGRLAEAIQQLEVYVATYERNGAVPGPRYFGKVCRNIAVECWAASEDLCQEGIAKACKKRVELLNGECSASHMPSCRRLAELLSKASPAPVDRPRAKTLLQSGCDAGDGRSCALLAALLAEGRIPGGTPARIRQLRRKACNMGHAPACGPR